MYKSNDTRRPYPNEKELYEALTRLEAKAIRYLSKRLKNALKNLKGIYLLSEQDIEELNNDAILVTLQKLTNGQLVFQGYSPVAYATAVARRLLANRLRKHQLDTVQLDGHDRFVDLDPEQFYLQKEVELALAQKLRKLGSNCEQLIRLKYFYDLKDKEVIAQKLTPYSTVNSIKNRRSQCLKKLLELLRQDGELFTNYFE